MTKNRPIFIFSYIFGLFFFLSACSSSTRLVGAGAFSPALSKLSTNSAAAVGTLAPLSYPLGFRAAQRNSSLFLFESIDINPLGTAAPEGGMTQYHSQVRLGLSPSFCRLGPFELSFFGSAHFNIFKGDGEAVSLNNGTGNTTFYTPGATHVVQTLNLGGELGFVINNNWMVTQGLLAETPFSKSRRQWAGFISLWYRWKGKAL